MTFSELLVYLFCQSCRNRLHERGITAWHSSVGPVFTAQHLPARLVFAREHKNGRVCHWCPAIFADDLEGIIFATMAPDFSTHAHCEPALICEQNRAPIVDLVLWSLPTTFKTIHFLGTVLLLPLQWAFICITAGEMDSQWFHNWIPKFNWLCIILCSRNIFVQCRCWWFLHCKTNLTSYIIV